MIKEEIYSLLEDKLLGYLDYIEVPIVSNNESLLPILNVPHLKTSQIDLQMIPHTGDSVYVRQSVLNKLSQAAILLASYDPTLELEVVYGYRTLEIQTQLFEKYKLELSDKFSGTELIEAVHQYIAVPEVAGHPTGGAIDIQILQEGKPIDFGTKIWEFVKDSLTFSPFISKEAWRNRQLLRRMMLTVGFAPFDGEWWHFSYGDKEWAKYYKQPFALYEQLGSSPKYK